MDLRSIHKSRELGQGSFGIVYQGSLEDGTEVAIKVLRSNLSEEAKRRFCREVRLQGQLDHVNVMPILFAETDADEAFLVMPLGSVNLRTILTELNEEEKISAFIEICHGVQHAHEEGVIHRDLKPDNVLFVNGVLKISDFGLCMELDRQTSVLTRIDQNLGTVFYMAPEQIKNPSGADERADIYALGKILYELLTEDFPVAPDLTGIKNGYRFIIDKCIRSNPSDRFYSVAKLVEQVKLVSRPDTTLDSPMDAISKLMLIAARNVKSEDSLEVMNYFLSRANDGQLYRQALTKVPFSVMELIAAIDQNGFETLMLTYALHVAGDLTFSYVDEAAQVLSNGLKLLVSPSAMKEVFKRLLIMGYRHNRYFVRSCVRNIVCGLTDRDLIQSITEVIYENQSYAAWYSECTNSSTPEIISTAFTEANMSI
ncbi:MAG: serine/threonine protein kinase [Armatimonadetes bacterium]|nr:serine/threonine protein kinase [Armatimonadota bacterium]